MSAHPEDSPAGTSLWPLFIGIGLVWFILAVLVVPFVFSSRRISPERSVATSLKTLATAEADFRINDRDWNHVIDFWTGDVKGLYTMTSAAVRGGYGNTTTDPAIKLIELSLASADADPTFFPAGGENSTLQTYAVSSAKSGYWFAALNADGSIDPAKEDPRYRQDTGGDPPMGPCHHVSRFGFVCFPDSLSADKYVYIVNENNTVFRAVVTGGTLRGPKTPPGVGLLPSAYLNWPSEADLKKAWSKMD